MTWEEYVKSLAGNPRKGGDTSLFTPDTVRRIRRRVLVERIPKVVIAATLGCNPKTIYNMVSGRTYAHVI